PQLGESVTEGQVVRWLKAPGERVARFEPVVEVLTDKVTVQVPSPAEGVLGAIHVGEGQTVPVGTVLAVLETEVAQAADAAAPASGPAPAPPASAAPPAPAAPGPAAAPVQARGLYSPAVRRLAQEYGVDPSRVQGTGEGGRVTREDVLRAAGVAEGGAAARVGSPGAAFAGGAEPPQREQPGGVAERDGEFTEQAPAPVRAVIARRMAESWAQVPHAWTMVEADVTALSALRDQLQGDFYRREGFELTFLPFAIRAAAEALREVPELNACWVDGRIRRFRAIHVGVAVGLEDGLVVPVVRHADRLSVVGIARAVHELVSKARAGKLSPDELQGATFTVNNTGALGSVLSRPIVPPGQGAILTTEAVTRRLVVLKDDQLAIRSILPLCLSFDHRLCDGVHALRFLQAVRRRLEAYGPGSPLT
ncbi:MAG TPA: dihydrolipoamide acetyltransferase family protein, partial [Limnochordales bacterium]